MLSPLICNSANNDDDDADAENSNSTFCDKYINNNNKFMEQFWARKIYVSMIEY
jgi:hypothetical protein